MSAWVEMIKDEDADSDLADALALSRTPHGTVDNVMRVHSLRPATMRGHVELYRAVLHDEGNTLPMWLQECIASWVSILNQCEYSLTNHLANAAHLIGDEARAAAIEKALHNRRPADAFNANETRLFEYAEKLTLNPASVVRDDIEKMRDAGYDDGEILEANQIVCYFNYVNRSLNGLGVTTENDTVGYYGTDEDVPTI